MTFETNDQTRDAGQAGAVSRRAAIGTGGKALAGVAALALVGAGGRPALAQEATPEATPDSEAGRYIAIRNYELAQGVPYTDIVATLPGYVDIISQIPGYVAYYNIVTSDTTFSAINIFNDEAGAQQATDAATQYVADNAANLVVGEPQTIQGAAGYFNEVFEGSISTPGECPPEG